ncbi:MAG: hypothetical protein PF693_19315 [Spirochaetia bacterium]|nr:hypothetical protein [Spirochaetia bacterium]
MITIGSLVFAGSIWDGSVSTARYGYLPQKGLYAASNAFPQNSTVTVTNPNTGKKVDVLILERLEDNNLFLVLSEEAAESIGISYGDIFYGNISEQDINISSREEELPYNPDPDVNPSAASENYSELALIQNYLEELGGNDDTLVISDIADPIEQFPDTTISEDIEEVTALEESVIEELYIGEPTNIISEPEVVIISEPEVVIIPEQVEEEIDTIVEDIPVIVGMSTDVPVMVASVDVRDVLPELPVPENDKPVVTLLNSGIIEETENVTSAIKLPELPIIGVEIVEIVEIPDEEIPIAVNLATDIVPFEKEENIDYILPELVKVLDDDLPEHSILVEEEPEAPLEIILSVSDPEVVNPEEDSVIPDTLNTPENVELEVEVVLEPSNLRPPVLPEEPEKIETGELIAVTEIIEIKESPDTPVGKYNITKVLAEDSYYLQLGVYREQYSAFDLAGRLGGTYPVTVLVSESTDNLNYKVMVGPLGQDESGVIFYNFKSTGYPDAFLRKGL